MVQFETPLVHDYVGAVLLMRAHFWRNDSLQIEVALEHLGIFVSFVPKKKYIIYFFLLESSLYWNVRFTFK